MRRYLALALASVLAVVSVSALAMGLGEIRLNSYLNQRLDAEIELVSAAADELESLQVRLADRAAFERYGLPRDPALSSLQFRVVRRDNGTAYVRVTSSEPIREPFLSFLVEADWSRGRVLREYTVLLDPPTFASAEQQPEAAQAQAPVVESEPRVPQAAPVAEPVREVAPAEPVRMTETQTGDVVDIPSLDEEAAPRAIPGPKTTPDMGETYGPIQRNETLWGIAQRLRPDESVTINQMMIALYRANPEAFQGNINRLKAGYILRIPDFADIRAISRSEAFQDVKRQNEAWRSGARSAPTAASAFQPAPETEPELSLVAPEEDLGADTGLGAETGVDETVGSDVDTGLEEEFTTDEPELAGDAAVDLGVEAESTDRLLDVEDESLQALQTQDDLQTGDQTAPPPLPESGLADDAGVEDAEPGKTVADVAEDPAAETAAETTPSEPAVAPAPVREPTLVETLTDKLFSALGLGIAAFVLVVLLAGFLVIRKRREAVHAKAAAAMAEWEEDNDATVLASEEEDGDATIVAGAGADEASDVGSVFAHGMEHEDTGTTRLEDDAEATQMLEDADKTQLMGSDETPAEGGDDFTDTVFGGQAVTLDDNDPLSEADFHMAYGLYDQAAEVVEKAVQRDPSRKDYLAKLAEIHFAANNTDGFMDAAGKLKAIADSGDPEWENVAIMGRQIAPDNELFGEAGSASSVDLDFGSADEEFSGEETVAAAPARQAAPAMEESLDFDIPMDTGDSADSTDSDEASVDLGPTEQESTSGGADDSLDFDLDVGGSEQPAAETPADSDDSDFDFDLGELEGDEGVSADGGFLGDDDTTLAADPEAADSDGGYNSDDTQTEFDKALEELSAFVDTNVPEEDAGDATSSEDDAGLSLDDYSFDQDDAAEPSADDSTEGTGDDEDDIGEIGTKLDLARAYIDMGDPDGARSILEEVVTDGDEEQQKEARELLDQLG